MARQGATPQRRHQPDPVDARLKAWHDEVTLRIAAAAVLLGLAACQPSVKGPGESGQPVYYDPARGISSDGTVYPQP